MQPEELKETFDQQASGYDKQSAKMAPIYDGLHFLLEAVFSDLPSHASVLCVGVGTGAELVHLAQKFPRWRFTAVDPSGAMLDVCRAKAAEMGFVERCHFLEGYVESLPVKGGYDAATCFLVSQFLLEPEARAAFFHHIAQRLKPGGILASADLASEVGPNVYEALLKDWLYMMTAAEVTPERLAQMRATYANHVSILPPLTVAAIIESGGFETPVQFFQAGLIHAWHARRALRVDE
jgi:tRNA (cmo5U34)-methyltransferase